jgi:hypothetical protein
MLGLHKPDLISQEVVFIDGLTRAGKFLLGKLASNLEGMEYFQSQSLLEQLPLFDFLQLMPHDNLVSFFRLYLNNFVYERFVGRNVNARIESSGIHNATDFQEYLDRGKRPDGKPAVQRALAENRLPTFLVHNCLPHVRFFHEAVPAFRMLSIQRHPLDIIYSWFQRGWGDRWGMDNLVFSPALDFHGEACPWFAWNWVDEWSALKDRPIDRVIKSILTLYRLEDEAYAQFPAKEQIHRLSYEDLFDQPERTIDGIAEFLGRTPYRNMQEILAREGCPNPHLFSERESRVQKVKQIAGKEYYAQAAAASKAYDLQWNLRSCNY